MRITCRFRTKKVILCVYKIVSCNYMTNIQTMTEIEIESFSKYLEIVGNFTPEKDEIILFRGQSDNYPLLPSIARKNAKIDTSEIEKEMVNELIRRTQLKMSKPPINSWEWLVYAQHFGMKTRLLDWTSNPLTALWFACTNEHKLNLNSYVYLFVADTSFLVDTKEKETPFDIVKTRILKPALNNDRIIAQAGWFTVHKYSNKVKQFVPLEKNSELGDKLIKLVVPAGLKKSVLKSLSVFGINSQTLFPDISGVCSHLNWKYIEQ